ncbi:MAG: hypothetical protein ACHQET_00805 [Chitinophagales bacterium]
MNTVHFQIERHDSVKDIQERFSNLFPYVHLSFLTNKGDKKPNSRSATYCPEVKMIEINSKLRGGSFEISDEMTVSQLENRLYNQFGLRVQVSRKSGNIWLETHMTNDWALKEQNDHGREISKYLILPIHF